MQGARERGGECLRLHILQPSDAAALASQTANLLHLDRLDCQLGKRWPIKFLFAERQEEERFKSLVAYIQLWAVNVESVLASQPG